MAPFRQRSRSRSTSSANADRQLSRGLDAYLRASEISPRWKMHGDFRPLPMPLLIAGSLRGLLGG